MSINGVDYTKQLAKDREYFQDSNRKTKEAADKRIANVEERADHVMQKQRENFIEDKAELEGHYKKNLDGLKDKTRASLENSNDSQAKQLEEEREAFTQESLKRSKDFNQRLNDIKSSYGKAFDSEADRNQDLEKTLKTKYAKNVDNIRNDSDEKMKNYQDRLTGVGADLKDQYNRERQQLVRAQEDRLTDVYKDAAHKRSELKNHIMTDVKKSKEVQQADLEHQREYSQDRMKEMDKKYQDRFTAMATDYSERNDNLVKSQQRNAVKTNRDHSEQLTDARRDYNKSLRLIELDKRRRNNGSGEFAEVVDKQQGKKDEVIHENKVRHLKGELVEAQRNYQHRANREQDEFNVTLRKQATEGTANLDRKLNESNADKIVTVAKEREKSEYQLQNRDNQNRLERTAYEQQLMLERNNANTRINKLKESFNASMTSLEEKQKASLEDVTKVSNADKTEFVKRMQENRSKEIFELKRDFNKVMDATVQDYETRLSTYQRDNEYLKMTMDQKVSNIIDHTEKKLTSQKALFDARHAADVKGQQLLMDQKEAALKKNLSDMNIGFQKKIDKMQIDNDSKLKLITNEYENKLKELKATTVKEMAMKDTNHEIELDRLKKTYENEKSQLVSAHQAQLESVKSGHKEQMAQMQDFKRLS